MGLSSEGPELPMDLVMGEILTRLPAKSLMRFKCVTKLWLWLISSRYFINRFLTVPSPRLYMRLWDSTGCTNYEILTSTPSSTTPSSFVVDHDLTVPRMGGFIRQNLRGFMCYAYWRPRIYNPATRQLVILPRVNSKNIIVPPRGKKRVRYFFGYDPTNDCYKLVSLISVFSRENMQIQVISSENWVLVVKDGGGSWKKAAPTPPDFCPHVSTKGGGGLCIDGVIYYLALTDSLNFVVVNFDIRSEEFNMIQVPRRDNEKPMSRRILNATLLEIGGKATLFDSKNLRDKGVVALWTVEDGPSKKWSCKSLILKPSQLPLVNNSIAFKVKCTTQNGNVLLIPQDFLSPFHILSYDVQSNDLRKIEIKGISDHWFSMDKAKVRLDVMFMDQSESLINFET